MFATGAFEDIISAWYFTTPVAQSTINIRSLFAHSPSQTVIQGDYLECVTQEHCVMGVLSLLNRLLIYRPMGL